MLRMLFAVAVVAPSVALGQAQTPAGNGLTEQRLYSLYAARHAATVKFAELGSARASNGDVKKLAERIAKAERETNDRLQAEATKSKIQIVPVEPDTTDAMLASATAALTGTSGAGFDSEWTNRAYTWLSTLLLDNNINVSGKLPDGDLKKIAQAYSTFQFHLMADVGAVQKKLR